MQFVIFGTSQLTIALANGALDSGHEIQAIFSLTTDFRPNNSLDLKEEFPFPKVIRVNIEVGEISIYIEVLCPNRDNFVKFLASNGIQARFFYHDLDTADYFGCVGGFSNSRKFGEQGLFLHCGPNQPFENINRVIEVLSL